MNVYDEMNNLCKAMKESREFSMMKEARIKLATDKTAEPLVKDFLKQKQDLEIIQYSGKQTEKADIEKVQKLYEVLQLNPVAAEYLQTYIRFQMMVGDISKSIGDTIKEAVEG
ncbi:hypothetical protein SDC9_32775 [bioreactor metagenome]|jgi:Uncharacterized conserved protein|uniref:YlbF family regulator n=1 Tax=bioreactor metagenome TaxID=1076179 RepID=A0A644V622_9ZZZZ|nr:YlbF family regulator [Acidaminococcaceae bacterium]